MSSKVCEWKFTRVSFGAGPSPFLLNTTLHRHIEGYGEKDPEFVRLVVRSLFVDDFVGGGSNVEEVILFRGKLEDVMKQGGFTLHKWKSNSDNVLSTLTKEKDGDKDATFAKQSLNQEEWQS